MLFGNLKFHPFMDAESDVGGGAVAPQDTGAIETTSGDEPGSVTEPTATDPASQKVQTPEQNRAFAEMRRRAEASERRAAEVEAQRQSDVAVARKYGKDYGVYSDADIAAKYGQSHGITTVEQFEAALQDEQYRQQGLDPDAVNQIVSQSPVFRSIQQQQQQILSQYGKTLIEKDFEELTREHSEIKSMNDLYNLPNYERIRKLVGADCSLLEAYEVVNRAEIRKRDKESGAQQTIRNINSKSHLGTEKSGNQQQGREVEISAEKMRVWKSMGYAEAQARQKEAKYLKK